MRQELPEQLITLEHLDPQATVLELGGNIGRNSLVIARILADSSKFVSLECNPKHARELMANRALNGEKFLVEPSALSRRKLYQLGWNTFTEENKPVGAKPIPTITWPELQRKYGMKWDTLIVDCEGALFQILMDTPELLDNIKLVIVENDYASLQQKMFVDKVFVSKGLTRTVARPGPKGIKMCCQKNFYEVWKKP